MPKRGATITSYYRSTKRGRFSRGAGRSVGDNSISKVIKTPPGYSSGYYQWTQLGASSFGTTVEWTQAADSKGNEWKKFHFYPRATGSGTNATTFIYNFTFLGVGDTVLFRHTLVTDEFNKSGLYVIRKATCDEVVKIQCQCASVTFTSTNVPILFVHSYSAQ